MQLAAWRYLLPTRGRAGTGTGHELEFRLYRSPAEAMFFGTILVVAAIEPPLLHLFASTWNDIVAWVLTGLTIAAVAWVVGLARAARVRPSSLNEAGLHLVDGLFEELHVPLAAIADHSVEPKPGTEGSQPTVMVFDLKFNRSLPISKLTGAATVESYSFEVADEAAVSRLTEFLGERSKDR